MTTVMLIFGMLPIALGQGPGSGSRGSIARVIVGGQALSLLITLLITPVAYSLFDDLRAWRPSWATALISRLRQLGAYGSRPGPETAIHADRDASSPSPPRPTRAAQL